MIHRVEIREIDGQRPRHGGTRIEPQQQLVAGAHLRQQPFCRRVPQQAHVGEAALQRVGRVVVDPDANNLIHWVITGLDPTQSSIGEGDVPVSAIEAVSQAGSNVTGYRGPCPPAGTTHHYTFTLYALAQQVELPTGSSATDLLRVIQTTSISSVSESGTYSRTTDSSTTSSSVVGP